MADYVLNKMEISGVSGNDMAQPRVFAHGAKPITVPSAADSFDIFPAQSPSSGTPDPNVDNIQTNIINRGACLYVGTAGNLYITLEDGSEALFKGVTAGSFLPVLAIKVWGPDKGGSGLGTNAGDIIALF
tara:strand:- start:1309 stop:1698 length:390 start_codon:yes stop_codon:yes gene_type:complete